MFFGVIFILYFLHLSAGNGFGEGNWIESRKSYSYSILFSYSDGSEGHLFHAGILQQVFTPRKEGYTFDFEVILDLFGVSF